jgi:hypothetical protein
MKSMQSIFCKRLTKNNQHSMRHKRTTARVRCVRSTNDETPVERNRLHIRQHEGLVQQHLQKIGGSVVN